jgi:hypothetical protein
LLDAALKPWSAPLLHLPPRPSIRGQGRASARPYARIFGGERLWPNDYLICADQKSQLQALGRRHETFAPAPGRPSRYKFENELGDTLAYRTAWDVQSPAAYSIAWRRRPGSRAFARVGQQVMTAEPYASAKTV